MSPLLLYIARAGLYLSLLHAFYLLLMRRTTFFRLNRVLLLLGSYLCLLLPFVRLRTVSVPLGQAIEAVAVQAGVAAPAIGVSAGPSAAISWQEILLAFYLAGVLLTFVLFVVSAMKMRRLIRSGDQMEREGCHLVLLESEVPSFSWGRKVVMSRKDFLHSPAIFTHELMHVQRHHSLDLLLFLPLQCLFWWNPLLWVTREELRLLHEYEADEGVLQKGIDATQYQLLLVLKAVGEERFSLASGFQHAKLKNRISMMKQTSSSGWMRLGYLALIPVLAAFMFACNPGKNNKAQAPAEDAEEAVAGKQVIVADEASEAAVNAGENEKEAIPYQLIEQKPGFNGGDAGEFSKWVNGQIKYPEQAKMEGIQGRVVLQFTVGEDGQVRDAKVLRGVHDALDAEALRVVSASPKWEPGRNKGKAVSVIYTFPVVFKIQ